MFKKKVLQVEKGYLPKGTYQSIHFGLLNVNKDDAFTYYLDNTGTPLKTPLQPFGLGRYAFADAVVTTCQRFQYGAIGSDGESVQSQSFHIWELVYQHALIWFNLQRRLALVKASLGGTAMPLTEGGDSVGYWARALRGAGTGSDTPSTYYRIMKTLDPLLDSKISVVDTYRTYTFRNNSSRTMNMCIYDAVPKVCMDVGSSFYQDWLNACMAMSSQAAGVNQDIRDDQLANSQINQAYPQLISNNDKLMNPHNLAISPYIFPELTKRWKIATKNIVLEPGQTFIHKVQGPKNCTIDPKSYKKPVVQGNLLTDVAYEPAQTTWASNPTYSLSSSYQFRPNIGVDTLIQVIPDLSIIAKSGTPVLGGATSGFIPLAEDGGATANRFGIAIKCTKYASFRMPDQAGFDSAKLTTNTYTAYDTQMLNKRKPFHFRWVWDRINTGIVDESLIDRIDPLNPVQAVVDT